MHQPSFVIPIPRSTATQPASESIPTSATIPCECKLQDVGIAVAEAATPVE